MRNHFDTENILKTMTQCWIVQSGPHVIICLLLDALASLDGIILIICNIFFNISEEKKLFISSSDRISDKTWAQLGQGGARISLKQMRVEVTSDIDHTSLLVKQKSCFVAHPMTGLLGFGSVVRLFQFLTLKLFQFDIRIFPIFLHDFYISTLIGCGIKW